MFDPDAVSQWLRDYYGGAPGLMHICSTGNWSGRAFPTSASDQATAYVAQLDATGAEGIYARATTLLAPPGAGSRGSAADTMAVIALWADLDIAGPGHKEAGLPPDETTAAAIIVKAGLPEPSAWVHSGGGLYPYWFLPQPHVVNGDLPDVMDLCANWQRVIGNAADALGWRYGTGVGDLARVLRIPGTVNRKAGLCRPARRLGAPC